MPPTRSRTERPYAPLLYAVTVFSVPLLSVSGRLRNGPSGGRGVANETPPLEIGDSNLDQGPWQSVSFTGAVSSQKVTEEYEGWLSLVGNQVTSIWI